MVKEVFSIINIYNNTIAAIAILIVSVSCNERKSFEGTIHFTQSIKASSPAIADSLRTNFGDTITAYIKEGNYHQRYKNAASITDIYYSSKDNNWYIKKNNIDTLFFVSCANKFGEKLIGISKQKTETPILNYKCNQLIVKTSSGEFTYYYCPELYINPNYFARHKFQFYDLYATESKSVYLGLNLALKESTIDIKAFSIDKTPLPDSVFQLPALPRKKLD